MTATNMLKTVMVATCWLWFTLLGWILAGWWGLAIVWGIFALYGAAIAENLRGTPPGRRPAQDEDAP